MLFLAWIFPTEFFPFGIGSDNESPRLREIDGSVKIDGITKDIVYFNKNETTDLYVCELLHQLAIDKMYNSKMLF